MYFPLLFVSLSLSVCLSLYRGPIPPHHPPHPSTFKTHNRCFRRKRGLKKNIKAHYLKRLSVVLFVSLQCFIISLSSTHFLSLSLTAHRKTKCSFFSRTATPPNFNQPVFPASPLYSCHLFPPFILLPSVSLIPFFL